MCLRIAWIILALIILGPAQAQDDRELRVGLLRFGTVAWEIDTLRHHGIDRKHGITVVPVEFASNEAAKVALQAGAVDMIVTDWPWVARQRGEGSDFSFVPYSRAVGALMVPPASDIGSLSDLKGKRIGVAGGLSTKAGFFSEPMHRRNWESILQGQSSLSLEPRHFSTRNWRADASTPFSPIGIMPPAWRRAAPECSCPSPT
jgi:ABC-type nitrate/sulfonate/bicarbonate transport system substrate-binding protein